MVFSLEFGFFHVLLAVAIFVFFCFAFVIAFGAPYLPTLKPQVKDALDLIDLKPGQRMLELGSGDGRILLAAAEKGIYSVGYELNPFLVLVSKYKTRKYKKYVTIKMTNFWNQKLPEADGIFTFLLQRYMEKLDNKIIHEQSKPTRLVSFAFEIPGKKVKKSSNGLFLYLYH